MDEFKTLITLVGTGSPAISVIALWFAWKKDRDMGKMTDRFAELAEKNAVANERVAGMLEVIRDLARPK